MDEAAYKRLIRGQTRGVLPTLARLGLWNLSLPYAAAIAVRNAAFDRGWMRSERAGVPVVSIGNLTVGGTGKTPAVEFVASWLRKRGLQVAILSRGYGATDGPNDEALLLEENLPDVPHLQGKDRVRLARIAVEELESQFLVLDDGFQHRRLARDLDIVLVDATDPFGGGRLLPAGLLRESPKELRRADLVLLTRCGMIEPSERANLRDRIRRLAGAAPIVETSFVPVSFMRVDHERRDIVDLVGKRVLAFSGIGNPDAFRTTLSGLGVEVIEHRSFPDHHGYTREDVLELTRGAKTVCPDALVTTQKDLVKLQIGDLAEVPLYALRIEMRFESGAEDFEAALARLADQTRSS